MPRYLLSGFTDLVATEYTPFRPLSREIGSGTLKVRRNRYKGSLLAGTVELVVGSMFSGKSEELIRRIKREKYGRREVALFKPSIDNRYSVSEVVTHDGTSFPAHVVEDAMDILNIADTEGVEVVGIDEAQFFPEELVLYVHQLAARWGKDVIIAGLDTDFRGEPFPTMVPLMFRADELTKLRAKCHSCGADASCTQRLSGGLPVLDGEVVSVGGQESYEARCRDCFVVGSLYQLG